MNDSIIKLALLQINSSDNKNIVKSAGAYNYLKNLWKKFKDPEYKDAIESIQQQFAPNEYLIKDLDEAIVKVEKAIKESDLEAYQNAFSDLQKLTLELSNKINVVPKEIAEDKKEIPKEEIIEEPKPISKKFYTKEELAEKQPEVIKELERQLQKKPEHDVSFGSHDKAVQSYSWFKQFSPNDVIISETAGKNLISQVARNLKKIMPEENIKLLIDDSLWISEFISEFKKAIMDGTLKSYTPPSPTPQVKHRPVNQNIVEIRTSEFLIPRTPHSIQLNAFLIDMMAGRNPSKQLKFKLSKNVNLRQGKTARHYILTKLALLDEKQTRDYVDKIAPGNEIPRKVTSVSREQFADIMLKGFQKAFGKSPNIQTLGIGWAQGVLESSDTKGSGKIILPGNNVGNIKADDRWVKGGGKYTVMDTKEIDSKGKSYTHIGAKWKAFDTPEDGAAYYWTFLSKRPEVLESMSKGDPMETAIALKKSKYFTANLKQYGGAMGSLYQTFMTAIAPKYAGKLSGTISTQTTQISIPTTDGSQVDTLIKDLFATQKITNLIKQSLFPTIYLKIGNHQNKSDKIILGQIFNQNVRQLLQAKSQLLQNKNDVIVKINNIDSKPVIELASYLSERFFIKTKQLIPIINVAYNKQYSFLSPKELSKHQRQFSLKYIGNK